MKIVSFLGILLALACANPARAADQTYDFYIYPEDVNAGQPDPYTSLVYAPPLEPSVPKITYKQITPPASLQQQLDNIIMGVTVLLPPEFDHYGYEMRRYMANVGNPEIYADPERLKQEKQNIDNAEIVFTYWMSDLQKQMQAIEKALDEQDSSSGSLRSSYNYNRGIVAAFRIEAESWLESNAAFLDFLIENSDIYTYEKQKIKFTRSEAMDAFATLYDVRARARKQINKYQPFTFVVY